MYKNTKYIGTISTFQSTYTKMLISNQKENLSIAFQHLFYIPAAVNSQIIISVFVSILKHRVLSHSALFVFYAINHKKDAQVTV